MAGAGYKLFQTGDVLTAAQVNTYLNEQTVMVFASSTARTTALSGVLAEGMVSYLQDTNAVEVYNGSAWVGVSGAGDVTEVQAGVGISVASGTGPIPIITNSSTDLITTAGDLLYGTAADTVARLGIGTAGQVLKVNSGATAPEWGTAGGKVLQVVSATYATSTLIQSTSFTDTGLTVSITPTSATSKVLILVTQNFVNYRASGERGAGYQLLRGATAINIIGSGGYEYTYDSSSTTVDGRNFRGVQTIVYLDSPSTTSSTTYKTQAKLLSTANSSSITFQENNQTNSIILMEIGA
jgi:hypothetical protein